MNNLPQYDMQSLKEEPEASFWIQSHRDGLDPRPGYIAASKRRLVARIRQENQLQEATLGSSVVQRWQARPAFRLALSCALILLLLVNINIVGAAAQNALPDDPFYLVKKANEKILLTTASTQARKAELHTSFAQRRLAEMAALILEGHYDPIPQVAANFDYHVNQALGSLESVASKDQVAAARLADTLESDVFKQTQILAYLATTIPAEAQNSVVQALWVCQQGGLKVQQLFIFPIG